MVTVQSPGLNLVYVETMIRVLARCGIQTTLIFTGSFYRVNVLTSEGKRFMKDYRAKSLIEGVELAWKECEKRGWLVRGAEIVKAEEGAQRPLGGAGDGFAGPPGKAGGFRVYDS